RGPSGHVLIDGLVAEHHVTELAALVRHQDLDDLGALVRDFHHHGAVPQRVEIGGLAVDLLDESLAPYLDVRRLRLSLRPERRCLERDDNDHETREPDGDPAVHLRDLLPGVRDGNANALTIASDARRGASWYRWQGTTLWRSVWKSGGAASRHRGATDGQTARGELAPGARGIVHRGRRHRGLGHPGASGTRLGD